jgi:prepilin-type N-terminal cleavage/methylation domain-containing protein
MEDPVDCSVIAQVGMQNTPIRRQGAFTLIELLISIAILAVLTALFLASISKIKERASVTSSKASYKLAAISE